jgi:hypothetical protein
MNKNEKHRVPGFTAEQALERGASSHYAGVASRDGGSGGVTPQGDGCPKGWCCCRISPSYTKCVQCPFTDLDGHCFSDCGLNCRVFAGATAVDGCRG